MAKKTTTVSRWDLKKALKIIGVDSTNEDNVKKLQQTFLSSPEEIQEETEEEANKRFESLPGNNVCFGIVDGSDNHYLVIKAKFDLTQVEICGKFDNEARAVHERGKLEATSRREELKRKQREGN